MEKIYCDNVLTPDNDETNKVFLDLAFSDKESKDRYPEHDHKLWTFNYHKCIREELKLPNKIFSFVISPDRTKAVIATFPKEPDGNMYTPVFDEEQKNIYILVE